MAIATRVLKANEGVAKAARLILEGHPVAVPTETVYGLAADATNGAAVAQIYAAKGRPSFNPLIVHVPDLAAALAIGEFDAAALDLAERHWPGPLTLVVPLKEDAPIASLVTAGLPTIGLRVPAHPVMQALLRAVGRPLAAPSANASGSISPTRASHVLASLGGRVPLILDAGPCEQGLESTIVAATGGPLRLLRPGPVMVDAFTSQTGTIESPGQLASHYAPSKPLRLNAAAAEHDEYFIDLGDDLEIAAARLFDALHSAEASDKPRIAVAPVRNEGLGKAINDRLTRAAA